MPIYLHVLTPKLSKDTALLNSQIPHQCQIIAKGRARIDEITA